MDCNFSLHYPKNIVFGIETSYKAGSFIPPNANILIVACRHFEKSCYLDEIVHHLNHPASVNFTFGITPEPPITEVQRVVDQIRKEKINAVIAIGGGSVIDTAKAAAAIAPGTKDADSYFNGPYPIPPKEITFIAMPTTAGTGSEMTKNSVIIDPETKIKKSIRSLYMVPDAAIIDPLLTMSCPKELTINSALDALVQAIEAFTTLNRNCISTALAAKAVKLIFNNLIECTENLDSLEPRTLIAEGSMASAMAFSQSGLGAVHGLAHPIGSLLNIPHGKTCAILMPYVMKFNEEAAKEKYHHLAHFIGAHNFRKELEKLYLKLNIPKDFSEFGLQKEHFPFIVENCRSNSMNGNPVMMSDDDVLNLLEQLI